MVIPLPASRAAGTTASSLGKQGRQLGTAKQAHHQPLPKAARSLQLYLNASWGAELGDSHPPLVGGVAWDADESSQLGLDVCEEEGAETIKNCFY